MRTVATEAAYADKRIESDQIFKTRPYASSTASFIIFGSIAGSTRVANAPKPSKALTCDLKTNWSIYIGK
jgi:hypothetical protein